MRKAFTLSETLITLAIIGVIAAITLPVIIANHQKEALKAQFMKAYSDLNNISRKFYADNGISFSEYGWEHSYNDNYKALKKYIISTTHAVSAMDYNDSEYKKTYKTMGNKSAIHVCDDIGLFADAGGRLFGLNNPNKQNENGPVICVDINGLKGPNKYGYDFFIFFFTIDGRVLPMGTEDSNNTTDTNTGYNFFLKGSNYCNRNAQDYKTNLTCSFYALNDKNPNNPNKSYWKDFI